MLSADDRRVMLEACGTMALVPAGSLLVSPPEYPDPSLALAGIDAGINQINPVAMAAAEDVAALGITGGEDGTMITVMGTEYRVLSVHPSSTGFSALELGAV